MMRTAKEQFLCWVCLMLVLVLAPGVTMAQQLVEDKFTVILEIQYNEISESELSAVLAEITNFHDGLCKFTLDARKINPPVVPDPQSAVYLRNMHMGREYEDSEEEADYMQHHMME